jgi:hypothetical protein
MGDSENVIGNVRIVGALAGVGSGGSISVIINSRIFWLTASDRFNQGLSCKLHHVNR